ncbi:matrixin family metalloprotease [Sinomonas notoginsengisoli]|uniref:matrixin family metalloprotease n=1 Tax=Sinomonas notoginsengisoli TaxID=1457311 RepID=UPI001F3FB105|nr:matrixin family metalloprotease [Sinomonas notoginsengisoli]
MDDGERRLPRSSDGRIPQWAIDEEARRVLADLDRRLPPDLVRAARPARSRRRRRPQKLAQGSRRTALILSVAVGLVSFVLWVRWLIPAAGPGNRVGSDSIGSLLTVGDRPPPGFEEGQRPKLLPPPGGGTHVFLQTRADGSPVGYSPCRLLHYSVNPKGAPPGAVELVDRAASRIAATSGFALHRDDPTDEEASFDRPAYQPQRYGERWAPVIVGFSTPEQVPRLEGDTAGLGGSAVVQFPGRDPALVTGVVILDGPDLSAILARQGGQAIAEAIILHEFGHVLGLGHVNESSELMAERNTGQLDFGPGDRAGLAQLAAGTCRPDI